MNDTGAFVAGHYRHYKGQHYEVVLVANHSETEEPLVIYRCLYGDFSWWARPLDMFAESVLIDGPMPDPVIVPPAAPPLGEAS
jgi:hypothetical protein